jgi:predicted CxxxxCH...CXXCH cytochrome family protein
VKIVVAIAFAAACSTERGLPDSPATGVHPSGILDETSDAFHGKELERRGWDLALCAKCHGDDFRGGKSGVTCTSCHERGPTDCSTCHRGGPTTGAHAQHAASTQCGECHVVPASWDAPGHILGDTYPAEVVFGATAGRTLDPADRKGPPVYADGACANVYCHGDVLHAGGGIASRPIWNEPAPTGGCDRCHGAPPPSHARTDCASCHVGPHLDGDLQITTACNGCHGDATSAAPPRDLAGNLFTTAIGVGAHRKHVDAPSRLRGPMACETCHLVPATVASAGHIDSAAPAEVITTLGWDRSTESCVTFCHGAARPRWTGSGEVTCGSCHGMPPADPNHTPAMTLASCASCHARSITTGGTVVFDGTTTRHIDGIIDGN